jgi:hypothetical protein
MKPDWDKLMTEYDGHDSILIGDVDCTAEGKDLCGKVGVKGYPTIKWGDASDLQAYEGGRDLASLKKHAAGLTPQCSATNFDLCSVEQKTEIRKFMHMDGDELAQLIADGEAKLDENEANYKSEVGKLQAAYEALTKEKDRVAEEVKSSGLGVMKSCAAAKAKGHTVSAHDEL